MPVRKGANDPSSSHSDKAWRTYLNRGSGSFPEWFYLLIHRAEGIGVVKRPWVNRVDDSNHLHVVFFKQLDGFTEGGDLRRHDRRVIPLLPRTVLLVNRFVHPQGGRALLAFLFNSRAFASSLSQSGAMWVVGCGGHGCSVRGVT